jgi:phosphatidate cytidylyltransferase
MFNLPKNILLVMSLILCLLMAASMISFLLKKRYPSRDYKELGLRIKSWWWMILILFFVLSMGTNTSVVFFGFLSFIALKEFFSIVDLRQTDRRVLFWAYLSIPVQYYFIYIDWYHMFLIFIPVYVFLFLPIRMLLIGQTQGFIRSIGIIHWAIMLTVFCISHLAYLLKLPVKNLDAGQIGLLIYLLGTTQLNDVCQYLWGKSLGKHKIIPKISPSKTWEGFLGGVVTISVISGFIAPFLTPLSHQEGVVFGAVISVSGFFGDVVISSVKRDLQIKDSGQLIPGHGGILDRVDSLIYTAPIFFHLLNYSVY